jgi:hypothetical protein
MYINHHSRGALSIKTDNYEQMKTNHQDSLPIALGTVLENLGAGGATCSNCPRN